MPPHLSSQEGLYSSSTHTRRRRLFFICSSSTYDCCCCCYEVSWYVQYLWELGRLSVCVNMRPKTAIGQWEIMHSEERERVVGERNVTLDFGGGGGGSKSIMLFIYSSGQYAKSDTVY